MNYPKIYLAIDNCFASKRWTKPSEWMPLIQDLGVNYIEASADNELDPLYSGKDYLHDWIEATKTLSQKTGAKIANFYSGHGTYATLGLGHTDVRIRDRFLNQWLKVMVSASSELDAGLGFFTHAFPESVLQDKESYQGAKEDLYSRFAELSRYASEESGHAIAVEQMYSPHQIPWTIKGARELLSEVKRLSSGKPFYITIDVGHQCGQRKYLFPQAEETRKKLQDYRQGKQDRDFWLGPRDAYRLFYEAGKTSAIKDDAYISKILDVAGEYPHLFASYDDGDPYNWLEEFGCYTPIIHLQQTDGTASAHLPFLGENNRRGIIEPRKVLEAVARSYRRQASADMPPQLEKIYFTLELFSSTADIPEDIIFRLQESVNYWRSFIPEDGAPLDQLLNIHDEKASQGYIGLL